MVIAAVSCAYAGQAATVIAKVPFTFMVGQISLPAGDYLFYENTNGLIRIQSAHRDECMVLTVPGKSVGNDGKAKILFHRYGNENFLSQVFNGLGDSSLKLIVSKFEKERMTAASNPVAENTQPRDVVIFGSR
jgi:hypothetical protein